MSLSIHWIVSLNLHSIPVKLRWFFIQIAWYSSQDLTKSLITVFVDSDGTFWKHFFINSKYLNSKGENNNRRIKENFRIMDNFWNNASHKLSSIYQSQTLFLFQFDRLQTFLLHYFTSMNIFLRIFIPSLTFSHHAKGQVGKWSQITWCPDCSFFGNSRNQITVISLDDFLKVNRVNPTFSFGQSIYSQNYHPFGNMMRDWLSNSNSMRSNQIYLKLLP